MDDDSKNNDRRRPPRPASGARPSRGGDKDKRFARSDKPRPHGKGGDSFRKRDAADTGGEKRGYGPRRERPADASGQGGKFGDRKPRRFADGDSKPQRREGSADAARDERGFEGRKPRAFGDSDRALRERGDGPAKYWGKRPGKREREELKGGGAEKGERKFVKRDRPREDRREQDRSGQDRPRQDGPRQYGPRKDGPGRDRADRPAPRRFDAPRPRRQEEAADTPPERIAKRLARAGISSRRDAESLIDMGRVKVNGQVLTSPAVNVSASDRIEVDGSEIPPIERTRLFLFNKPAGVVTTNRDPEGRRTVFDILPEGLPRLMTVGRLDINTEGLLLLTNDGGLSRMLELPATGWLRRYRARVHGKVDEARLAGLKEGIAVEGVFYGAVEASLEREQGSNAWLTLGLREGKNREVKNILGALGLEVTRLIRVSYGPFQLGELEEGQVMEIKGRTLRDQLGERLIEESGANFDADIVKPFSTRPVRRGDDRTAARGEPKGPRRPREMSIGEGGLVKGFRRDRERARENALDRLTTSREDDGPRQGDRRDRGDLPRGKPGQGKPGFGKPASGKGGFGKPGLGKSSAGRRGDRDEKPFEAPAPRSSNVWMAPGARPNAKRPSERAAAKRDAGKRDAAGPKGGRPASDRPRSGGPRSGGPGKPFGGKPPRKG